MVPGFAQRVEALQFIYVEGKKKIFIKGIPNGKYGGDIERGS